MKKIFEFLRAHSWMWIIVVVLISIIGDAYITNKQKPVPTPTPVAQVATFKNIVPGVSTEADLNKIWGTPVKSIINGNQTTDQYKSTSELRLHSALVQGGKVLFIDEIVSAHDTTSANDITSVYGAAPYVLYSNLANSTFNLYVYPANGIAYLGHADGTLLEIWYFVPTTIDNFSATWGKEYSTSPPPPVQ